MTASFTGPIRLRPTSSALLATGIAFSHTGALAIVAFLPWPTWAQVSAAMLLSGSLLWSLAWHVLHRGDAVTEAILQGDGSWTVRTGHAEPVSATLANDSVVTPYLTVLVFKLADGRRRSLLVLPDNVEPETFRRLRVRLRFPWRGRGSPHFSPLAVGRAPRRPDAVEDLAVMSCDCRVLSVIWSSSRSAGKLVAASTVATVSRSDCTRAGAPRR